MKPIAHITPGELTSFRFLLTDIDDTLTEEGKLLEESYSALWKLKKLGIGIIPVTGRPAGWCDCIIRQWPVDAIIGENGAFTLHLEKGRIGWLRHPNVVSPRETRERLRDLGDTILSSVPGSRIAGDQFCRLYDLAIDFSEEEPRLSLEVAQRIKELAESAGATAKISSIHVNIWFGEYDKVSMAKYFLATKENMTESEIKGACFFCGDSPNDEPMFKFFPLSCGVANLEQYAHLLTNKPAFISTACRGRGFREIIDTLEKKVLKNN